MEQKPSIGRIVHFNHAEPDGTIRPHAAIIVEVHSDSVVSIAGFNEYGTATGRRSISFGTAAGEWQWPPRV